MSTLPDAALLLMEHGVRVIKPRGLTPSQAAARPLGGPRGVHLRGGYPAVEVMAYHPSVAKRLDLYQASLQTLRKAGWRITEGRRGEDKCFIASPRR